MLSFSIIASVIGGLFGSGAALGWLVRLGIMPFIPILSKLFELAFDLASIIVRGLGGAIAKSFESVWGVLLLAVFFYGGAWHFADWRPWHGFTKEKASIARAAERPAPKAPKVAQKAAKRDNDARSIFNRSFIPD